MKHKIGILGAGTWGMALARMLTVSGNDVTVWSALEQEIDNLSTTRVHPQSARHDHSGRDEVHQERGRGVHG